MITITDKFARRTPNEHRAWRRFERLSDDQRRAIERDFKRHLDACRKCEIDPDPLWLSDALEDMRTAT